jgi:hypothetical protein
LCRSAHIFAGLTSAQRDQKILRLHKLGWGPTRIAATVGMTKGGVQCALERIAAGRPGNDRRT